MPPYAATAWAVTACRGGFGGARDPRDDRPTDGYENGQGTKMSVRGTLRYAAPWNARQMLVYDIQKHEVTGVDVSGIAKGQERCKWNGIAHLDGLLFSAPAHTKTLLVYNIETKELRGVDVSTFVLGVSDPAWNHGFWSGVTSAEGLIYLGPGAAEQLLVVNASVLKHEIFDI